MNTPHPILRISSPTIDETALIERANRITKRSVKSSMKRDGLRMVLSMIDLTTLEGCDTKQKVTQLCIKAQNLNISASDLPNVAAVCVYPNFVSHAKDQLIDTGIRVASVATGFPSGQISKDLKIHEVKQAVADGADEIDMVISRGRFLAGDYQFVFDEIGEVKNACGDARLKVILETGELGSLDQVRRASDLAIAAGADFIKTSTGKISSSSTLPVALTMMYAIADHFDRTGTMVGMKPAGGISNSKLALHYLVMVKEILGNAWLDQNWFRFGASSLANDVLMQIEKQETGRYQSSRYFSAD